MDVVHKEKVGVIVRIIWPDLDIEEPAIVVLGDTEDELFANANSVFDQYERGNPIFDGLNMDDVQVIELHRDEWFVASKGSNLGRGWRIISSEPKNIYK
jgi:hypothetical protein